MKARMALFFSVMLVLAGLLPLLYFVAMLGSQLALSIQVGKWVPLPMTLLFTDHALVQDGKAGPLLVWIPEFRWTLAAQPMAAVILERLHAGLLLPILAFLVIPFGINRARRQVAVMRYQKRQREDRVRRIQDYSQDGPIDVLQGRREPFISSGTMGGKADRRVA